MTTETERQQILDVEHLRLLSLFHYISGGMTLMFSVAFGVMFAVFSFIVQHIPPPQAAASHAAVPPPWIVFVFFGIFLALGAIYGVLEILAGRLIARRRHRVFTMIVSIPRLITIPYGVILTVFTIIVLERKSVKELYTEPIGL